MKTQNKIKEISLEELTDSMGNHAKAAELQRRVTQLEEVGDRLYFLILNGTEDELKKAKWDWRELVPTKNK
jgi:hypothetical protein